MLLWSGFVFVFLSSREQRNLNNSVYSKGVFFQVVPWQYKNRFCFCCDLKETMFSDRGTALAWGSRPEELRFVHISAVSQDLDVELTEQAIPTFSWWWNTPALAARGLCAGRCEQELGIFTQLQASTSVFCKHTAWCWVKTLGHK